MLEHLCNEGPRGKEPGRGEPSEALVSVFCSVKWAHTHAAVRNAKGM